MNDTRPVASLRLYIITDRRGLEPGRDLVASVAATLAELPPGSAAVQLRENDLSTRSLVELARRLLGVARARSCPLLINERLDVALAVGADGVHLPERGMDVASARRILGPDGLVGASTHTPEDALRVARDGADIVLASPIWTTPKPWGDVPGLGTGVLERVRELAREAGEDPFERARLFALGGITTVERAARAVRAGAHGIAGIRLFRDAGAGSPHLADVYRALCQAIAQ